MKMLAAAMAAAAVSAPADDRAQAVGARPSVAPPVVHAVAPQLAAYTDEILFGDVWERPDLTKRDRSFVTVSALIAGGHVEQMPGHINRALDNRVEPPQLSGLITHLAFYAGWPRAMSAVGLANKALAERGLAPVVVTQDRLPFDRAVDEPRAQAVEAAVGPVAPALAAYTNQVLFQDLWLGTDLSPRDRSLATITALIVNGQAEQLPYHLMRGLDNGLTRAEIAGAITHLAFYAGWPRAMSAVSVTDQVFKAREADPQ